MSPQLEGLRELAARLPSPPLFRWTAEPVAQSRLVEVIQACSIVER